MDHPTQPGVEIVWTVGRVETVTDDYGITMIDHRGQAETRIAVGPQIRIWHDKADAVRHLCTARAYGRGVGLVLLAVHRKRGKGRLPRTEL